MTATCLDVDAAAQADGTWNACGIQDCLEALGAVTGGGLACILSRWVERDDIDVAEHPFQERGQFVRVLLAVVDGLDQGPLEGEAPVGDRKVAAAGLH